MLNLNEKNLHENTFEISEKDMAAAARSFNVIEQDEGDDIELDIRKLNVMCYSKMIFHQIDKTIKV